MTLLFRYLRNFEVYLKVYSLSRSTFFLKQYRQNLTLNIGDGMCSSSTSSDRPTAGIIVIGDEILKGQTVDTNSHYLCKRLFSLGVCVKQISVIPDDVEVISHEVAKFSKLYEFVLATGGVGPTHDDKTHVAVARAFNEDVIPHPQIIAMCKKFFQTDELTSAQQKLCEVARSAVLQTLTNPANGEKSKFPLVSVRNVYILPGVPRIMERVFESAQHIFKNNHAVIRTKEIYLNIDEVKLAPILADIDDNFHKHVIIGSYPDFSNSYYKVKVTMESEMDDQLLAASSQLTSRLEPDAIVEFDNDPVNSASDSLYKLMNSGSESDDVFYRHLRDAVTVIEEALARYRLDEICVGFNGGKDCTVLLHLFYAVAKRVYPDHRDKLQALYIRSRLPFPEVEKFIQMTSDRYGTNLIHLDGRIKESLATLKSRKPNVSAVVMGTRCTDPHSKNLESFAPTDPDWPQYMRVNPLLKWRYQDVWRFLRVLCLPYCNLYDTGYTSLGSMDNTHPNPSLQYVDESGIVCYHPAYKLSGGDTERAGRN